MVHRGCYCISCGTESDTSPGLQPLYKKREIPEARSTLLGQPRMAHIANKAEDDDYH